MAMVVVGCGSSQSGGMCPPSDGTCGARQVDQVFSEPAATMIDLLIVVDDSPSMVARREVLAALAAELASAVPKLPGPVDLQMLVATTSIDHASGECPRPPPPPPRCAADPFVHLTPTCGQHANVLPSIPDPFACAVVRLPVAALRCGWGELCGDRRGDWDDVCAAGR